MHAWVSRTKQDCKFGKREANLAYGLEPNSSDVCVTINLFSIHLILDFRGNRQRVDEGLNSTQLESGAALGCLIATRQRARRALQTLQTCRACNSADK